jgi:hypothetical protein
MGRRLLTAAAALLVWSAATDALAQRASALDDPGSVVVNAGQNRAVDGRIEADPGSIKMQGAVIGRPRSSVILVRNGTPLSLEISEVVTLNGEEADISVEAAECTSTPLPSGKACAIIVSVTPRERGPFSGVIVVRHSGQGSALRTEIEGTAQDINARLATAPQAPSDLVVDTPPAFANAPMSRALVVSNRSDRQITVTGVTVVGGSKAGLDVSRDACKGETLSPGAACLVTVDWAAPAGGAGSADFVVEHSGPSGVLRVPLAITPPQATASSARSNDAPSAGDLANLISRFPGAPGAGAMPPLPDAEAAPAASRRSSTSGSLPDEVRLTGLTPRTAMLQVGNERILARDGRAVRIGGTQWMVTIKPELVKLKSSEETVEIYLENASAGGEKP